MNERSLVCSKCWRVIGDVWFYIVHGTDTIHVWHERCKSIQLAGMHLILVQDVITSSHPVMDALLWRSALSVGIDSMPLIPTLRSTAVRPLIRTLHQRLQRWMVSVPEWGVTTPCGTRYNISRLFHTLTPVPWNATISKPCTAMLHASSLAILNHVIYATDADPMPPQYVNTARIDILRATPAEVTVDIATDMRRVIDSYICL